MTNKPSVLITEPVDPAGPSLLESEAIIRYRSDYESWEDVLDEADEFDAVIVRTTPIDASFIDRASRLAVISKHGVGLDNIDVGAATDRGIAVCRVEGANDRAVAEHAVAMILAIRKQLVNTTTDIRSGRWDRAGYDTHTLAHDTVGLFGCGAIGQRVLALLEGFDVDRLVYDPYVDAAAVPGGVTYVNKKLELFEQADVVSIHAPLTAETVGAIDATALAALGSDGIIVNTARGGIIDEDALMAALDMGSIAGAGLDVFVDEPPADDHPLATHPRIVTSPHIAGNTVESRVALSRGAANHVRTVLDGGLPPSTVNMDAIKHHFEL